MLVSRLFYSFRDAIEVSLNPPQLTNSEIPLLRLLPLQNNGISLGRGLSISAFECIIAGVNLHWGVVYTLSGTTVATAASP